MSTPGDTLTSGDALAGAAASEASPAGENRNDALTVTTVPAWRRAAGVVVIAAIAIGVFVTLVALFTDVGPWDALQGLVRGAMGSRDAVSETLTRAIPLALVGVGAAAALRAGIFNVGGEGQMAMGAVAATLAIRPIESAPALVVWTVAFVAAAGGGALWAAGPAALWAYRGVSEILSTLLVNFATVSLLTWLLTDTFLHDPDPFVITAQGESIPSRLELPLLLDGSRLHAGLFVMIVSTAVVAWWLRTPAGLRVDLAGANPTLAAQAGIRPTRLRVGLLLGSAAFAGIAGAVQLFGLSHRLSMGLTGGVGYTGLLVAVLGRAKPIVTMFAAIGFAALITGGEALETGGVPRSLVAVVQAVLVVGVALMTRVGRRS
jgi:simple sugar transport system permease protein